MEENQLPELDRLTKEEAQALIVEILRIDMESAKRKYEYFSRLIVK